MILLLIINHTDKLFNCVDSCKNSWAPLQIYKDFFCLKLLTLWLWDTKQKTHLTGPNMCTCIHFEVPHCTDVFHDVFCMFMSRLKLHNYKMISLSCSSCVGAQDPYCGWDLVLKKCTTLEESMSMSQWEQNISSCPVSINRITSSIDNIPLFLQSSEFVY